MRAAAVISKRGMETTAREMNSDLMGTATSFLNGRGRKELHHLGHNDGRLTFRLLASVRPELASALRNQRDDLEL